MPENKLLLFLIVKTNIVMYCLCCASLVYLHNRHISLHNNKFKRVWQQLERL